MARSKSKPMSVSGDLGVLGSKVAQSAIDRENTGFRRRSTGADGRRPRGVRTSSPVPHPTGRRGEDERWARSRRRTAEGGSISSGPPRHLRDASRRRLRSSDARKPPAVSLPPPCCASMRSVSCSAPSCSAVSAQRVSSGRSSCAHHGAGLAHLFGRPCVDRVHELFEWYSPSAGERIGGIESGRRRLGGSAPRGECPGDGLRRRTRLRGTGGGDAPGRTPLRPRLRHRPRLHHPPPAMRLRTPLDTRISGRNVLRLDWYSEPVYTASPAACAPGPYSRS